MLLDANVTKLTLEATAPQKWSDALKQFVCKSVLDHFMGLAVKGLSHT